MERKAMTEKNHSDISVRRQCELLGVNRNRLKPAKPKCTEEDLVLCRLIDEIHMEWPAAGARMIRDFLAAEHDTKVNRKRVGRLMKLMRIEAVYQRPKTSLPGKGEEHKVHPYLVSKAEVSAPDEVWCADITYIPMGRSFTYLFAIMDWHTRTVISWQLSNTLDTGFCIECLRNAISKSGVRPDIFNTDQGCQFTSVMWREELESHGIKISMDGKGCWVDNVFIERLWRTVKYEEIYLREYSDLHELERSLTIWFEKYNCRRPHSSLGGKRPMECYRPEEPEEEAA